MNLVVVTLLFAMLIVFNNTSEVKIHQGTIRGTDWKSESGKRCLAFIGIPYAEPPVGELRFQPPMPKRSWNGVLNATKQHAECLQSNAVVEQFDVTGDEDCLYLNVYTPQITSAKNEQLPVMFYIHGGGFVSGSATPDMYNPTRFLDKDIVIVLPNYRLGPLGFLSTGDYVVPGNNGLKDVAIALQWVKDNIAAFGGNPEKVTIVGNSAGAAIAHYLMLSPLTRDLISGAILESGTALSGWSFARNKNEIKNAHKLAKFLNCPTSSSISMIECMKQLPATEILKQEQKFMEWSVDPLIPFNPVIEPKLNGAFISEHPLDIIKSGKAANVPLITGITKDEGAFRAVWYYGDSKLINDIDRDFNRVMPISLWYNDINPEKDIVSRKLRQFYFGNKAIDITTKDNLIKLYSDLMFAMSADEAVRLHVKYNSKPVYYYLFGYRGLEAHVKLFGDVDYDGVSHADELLYLFKLARPFPNYIPSEEDNEMSEVLTTMWANFIKSGNPTPGRVDWKPVELQADLNYLTISGPHQLIMAKGLYTNRTQFVQSLNIYFDNSSIKDEL